MYNRLTMFTMDKSMLLEQVELRDEVRVAAAARGIDGVVAPAVAESDVRAVLAQLHDHRHAPFRGGKV